MKNINVTFEDSEFKKLEGAKGELSWREFILENLKGGIENGKNNNSKR